LIRQLKKAGHYLGSHSDKHLLYCDWSKRDSLLVTKKQFQDDLSHCYTEMNKYGIHRDNAPYFLPPYEWYNDSIAAWTKELGLQLINFTPGTLSNADYSTPDLKNYRDSKTIFCSVINFSNERAAGLNGFILLLHIGTDLARTDKFYRLMPQLLQELKLKGYRFQTVDQLLHP
jgi:peptidoglycan/xylan/chitin deacetylase (PgdA/CDA1 family)